MNCVACDFELDAGFGFCPKCGAKQALTCPSCAYECEPGFAFCPKCGSGLDAEAPAPAPAAPAAKADTAEEADRRPVTVLFADLSGFTALGERLDPEDIRALQTDLHREMAAVIESFEGFLEKFVGDAALAIFGAPVAHEDDPERALRAALAMRERIADLGGRWKARLGVPLTLHIGINTGTVVAGTLGAGDGGAYAVTGDTVNTAARLLSEAGDGEILVGQPTYRLNQHLFAFEHAGAHKVKGKDAPVEAYRLAGTLDRAEAFRGLAVHGLSSPLVGRHHELDQVLKAVDQALLGRAQVVRVVGDAGSGKTRLVEEVVSSLERDGRLAGIAVRRTGCSSLGDQTYGVLANLLREGYHIGAGDSLEDAQGKLRTGLADIVAAEDEIEGMVPYLSHVLGIASDADALAAVEPEQLKRQIFMAARAMFENRLRSGPVMLVCEDLHWADAASIELLRFLVDRLDDQPLMLLLTHRPNFEASQLATSRTSQTAIRLLPLSNEDCEAMISGLFGASAAQIPRRLRDFVIERASGNPFYLEEIIRSLIDGEVLKEVDGGWSCSDSVAILDIPLTIQGLLLSRLDRLPAEVRRVTQEASVLGVEFGRALLLGVNGNAATVDAALEGLRDAELIEDVLRTQAMPGAAEGDEAYRFTHSIVQEVVYQNLLLRRRTELHGNAGRSLEALCEGRAKRLEDLEALARHFTLGDDKASGIDYLIEAGDWARRAFANDDAVKHYRRALETIEECEGLEDRRLGLLESLADMLGPLGERDEALQHYESVLGDYAEADDLSAQARLYRKIANLHWESGARGLAFARVKAALGLIEGRDDKVETAHLYREMGRLAFRSGDSDGAVTWARKALAEAEPLLSATNGSALSDEAKADAAAVVSEAYNTIGVAQARLGVSQEAVAQVEKSLEVAQEHGLHQVACRAFTNLSVLYSELDPGRAIETCRAGLDVAKKIGDMGFQSRLYANLGVSYCTFTGRCEGEGVEAVKRAIDLDRQLGLVDHLPVSLIVLGQIYQCHGQPQMAIDLYREALSMAEELDEPQILFPCYDGLATVHLDIDDIPGAERYMEKAQQVCESAGLDAESLVVLPFLC